VEVHHLEAEPLAVAVHLLDDRAGLPTSVELIS
jgi:hypothetical protein